MLLILTEDDLVESINGSEFSAENPPKVQHFRCKLQMFLEASFIAYVGDVNFIMKDRARGKTGVVSTDTLIGYLL